LIAVNLLARDAVFLMGMEDLTEFERRLFEWIRQSDFETVAWSTERAAEAFDVDSEEVYEALAALTAKVPHNIYVHYSDGAIRISAE
jgi:hypothetical protein